MSRIPIVPHFEAMVSRPDRDRLERLADSLRAAQPELGVDPDFAPLRLERYEDGPTLHFDDLTAIPLLDRYYDVSFVEDRARFRAFDDDWVATCGPHVESFEDYCEERLALGRANWIHPRPRSGNLAVAQACWADPETRDLLTTALRRGRLEFLHPHMGNFAVWATALLLSRESGRPMRVVAPPPALTRKVNDKVWFATTVQRLFGPEATPDTAHAWNLSTLARLLHEFAPRSARMVVKRPDSAGGAGNIVIDSRSCRRRSLGELRLLAASMLAELNWHGEVPLLVGSWETEVLATPSSQLWIPPPDDGPPIVEGIFRQVLEGPQGMFVGCQPHHFSNAAERLIVNRSWMLGFLFQRLGYVGRCSFDMLLVGPDEDSCALQFVECNGRWGGASAPMTLMNRLFGDWSSQPYVHQEIVIAGLQGVSFQEVLDAFGGDLFEAATGSGRFAFYNPRALNARPGLDCLAFGRTWDEAATRMHLELPRRLTSLLAARRIS